MVNLKKTLTTASEALRDSGIAHALIGGFALANYGINRATADIDFLADGDKKDEIISSLTAVGFKLYHQTQEVLQFDGLGRLDIVLANRPISKRMLVQSKLGNQLSVRILSAEDIIGLKIQAYKNDAVREHQDKADIQALISKNPTLDWEKLKSYAVLFNEWEFIKSLRTPQ